MSNFIGIKTNTKCPISPITPIRKLKTADKYKSILLSSLVRCIVVHEHYIEIQFNYKNELPILQNPVKVEISYLNQMVTQGGFEPTTYRLEGGCSIQLSY